MLGYERLTVPRLQPEIDAVEKWGYQQAGLSASKSAKDCNLLITAQGIVVLFFTNVAGAIGAWSAYRDNSTWISKILKQQIMIGKILAGITTIAVTTLPMAIRLVNKEYFFEYYLKDYIFDETKT